MNRLQFESSPYLLQHAKNPVDWYPWGDEAFARARQEDKPVLVSIGYAACHWCHVMEQESFENEELAAYMNRHFISIKVDREEHPDVDHLYMDALQATAGHGGWPLNMFVTPDRTPFYGGTYYPPQPLYQRPSWRQVLEAVLKSWKERREEVHAQSQQLVDYLKNASHPPSESDTKVDRAFCDTVADNLLRNADTQEGGFGGAPKFPGTMSIRYLLEYYFFTNDENSLKHGLLSLDKMIGGGIYDQLGGGFARYATDRKWLVPHFEKMLYDNALLIDVLCDAYLLTKNKRYETIIRETISFCQREMRSEDGLYYSALDADSEGVEGKFYTWTWEEWKAALPDAHPAVEAFWGVTEAGNWEGVNILHQAAKEDKIQERYELDPEEWQDILEGHKQKLWTFRKKRIRPLADDKIILSWNALYNSALQKAAHSLHSSEYQEEAQHHLYTIAEKLCTNTGWQRIYRNGRAGIPAKLEDYAFLIKAYLEQGATTGRDSDIQTAYGLMKIVDEQFSDDDGIFFYFSSKYQQDIVVRKVETYDGALPSANAILMEAAEQLGNLYEEPMLLHRSEHMMKAMAATAMRYPSSFGQWCTILQRRSVGLEQLVISGESQERLYKEWKTGLMPHVAAFMAGEERSIPAFRDKWQYGKTFFYRCRNFACDLPLEDIDQVMKIIKLNAGIVG